MGKLWGAFVAVVARRGVVKRVRSFCRNKCQKAARFVRATGAPVHTTDRRMTNTKDSNARRAPTGVQVSPSIPIPPISSRRNQHIILSRARPALVRPDDLMPMTGLWSFRRDNFLPPPEEQDGPGDSLPADGTWTLFGSPGRYPQKEQEEGPTSADVQMEQNHDCSTASSAASSAALFSDLRRLTEAPDWLQNNQPRVFRHSHWHTSLTTRKPTLGKMVSSTYIRKTPRPPFAQVVSSTTSSLSALASLSRPSAGSSRTTIDISGEDRDRNRNRNRKQEQDDHDSYDDNEVAVESCSPNLGFAKMEFIASRIGPMRQGPSYPGCPSPPRQISQSLIDEVAAANNNIHADPSGLRYAREENTRAMKQKRPQRDNHFAVPELDKSSNQETMELSGWNKYNEDEANSLDDLSPSGLGFARNDHPSERFWSSGRDDHSHPHAHYLDASPVEELSAGSEEFDNNDEDGDILDLTIQAVAPSPSMAQSRPVQGTGPVQASSFHTEDLYHPRPYARRVDDSVIERLTAAAEAYEKYGGYSSVETHLRNCRFAEETNYNSRCAEPAGIGLCRSESHSPENPEKLLGRSLIEAMEAAAEY